MNYIPKLSNKHQKISPFLEITDYKLKKIKFDGNLSLLHNFVEKVKLIKLE